MFKILIAFLYITLIHFLPETIGAIVIIFTIAYTIWYIDYKEYAAEEALKGHRVV